MSDEKPELKVALPSAETKLPDVPLDPHDKAVPHLPRKAPLPERVFDRGRRCENCLSFQPGAKAETWFLAKVGATRPYMVARILIERANKKGEEIDMLRKQLRLAPNAWDVRSAIVHHERLLRTWAPEIREAAAYVAQAPPLKSNLNGTDLRIYASIRRKMADRTALETALYAGFGLASREDDAAGLCTKGAPGPDGDGSDLVASGYYCEDWSNPHAQFDQPDEIPAAIEENMDELARKRSMGTVTPPAPSLSALTQWSRDGAGAPPIAAAPETITAPEPKKETP